MNNCVFFVKLFLAIAKCGTCYALNAINGVVFLQMDRKTIICVGVAISLFILVVLGSIAIVAWRPVSIRNAPGRYTRGGTLTEHITDLWRPDFHW